MKIIAFNGSPRGEHGNTHFMVKEFLAGAEEAGAETENIFLVKKKIRHCLGCFSCWIKTPGTCAIDDDMKELISKAKEADVIVYATPLYVDNVSGIMKNFMDRSIPTALPYFEMDEKGECRHVQRYDKPQKIVVISNCGYPEQSHFQVIHLLFERVARNMHSEVIAEVYRGGGEILKSKNILLMPRIYQFKRILRKAGREVVERGRLSSETIEELNKPIISKEQYLKGAKEYWDKELKKIEKK